MNNNIGVVIGVVLIVVVIGAAYMSLNQGGDDQVEDTQANTAINVKGEDVSREGNDDARGDTAHVDGNEPGMYEEYAPEKLAYAETGDVVLFFHASWCPSCRGLNADIEKNLDAIPSGVSILKLDYDKESELRKKYSVTYQHTLVQVDADGTLIKKWSGSPTLTALVSEIK